MKTKGTTFLVLILVLACASPTAAVEWKLYGSVRMRTWYYDHDHEDSDTAFSSKSIWRAAI